MNRFRLAALVLLPLLASACRCGGKTNNNLLPDYTPSPAALSFSACPTKDSAGHTVTDVYPDTLVVTINNTSNVGGGLKLSITGSGAQYFAVTGTTPSSIDPNGAVDVHVAFTPDHSGDVTATLVIDDQTDGTDNVNVTLVGTGSDLPPQPTLETAPQKTDLSGYLTCADGSSVLDCTLEFPDTMFAQSNTLMLKLRNKGCPTLKVTGITITGDSGFTIDTPATLPSESAPMLLSTADGTEETTLVVRFSPTNDGSGNNYRNATLTVVTNDPANPVAGFISLTGQGIKPSIYVAPESCDFTNANDLCGNTAKVANQAKFQVVNDGNTPVVIESVNFKSSGVTTSSNNRFSITNNIVGQTLQPTHSLEIDASHVDQPIYVSDTIEVKAKLPGQASGSGGDVLIAVYGGTKPCLTTEPSDQLDFNNPTDTLTAQPLLIKNGAGCGTLHVSTLNVDTNPFFSVIDPATSNAAASVTINQDVAPGAQLSVDVQYKRPNSGGMQVGTLHVVTNDSDYAAPQYKIVQLFSQSPLDQLPVASISGCKPADLTGDPTCANGSASLSASIAALTPAQITISGAKSTDDNMVAQYRFKLLSPFPPGVTSANLDNNDTPITTPTTLLHIPAGGSGTYRVSLQVYDNRGQQSGNNSVLLLNVTP